MTLITIVWTALLDMKLLLEAASILKKKIYWDFFSRLLLTVYTLIFGFYPFFEDKVELYWS